ncbi:MAG: hypothetical protein WEC75_14465 [Dehalococcoidia bacterium]
MFFIRFFTGSIIGIISGLLFSVLMLFIFLAIVVVVLASTGGPGDCDPGGGPITVSTANSDTFKQKWDGFDAILDGGSPSSVTFNESELSSRAVNYLEEEEDTPFKDVRVCVHDGFGEATGRLDLLGIDVKIKLKGTVDLTGEHPDADIDKIEVGNVPGFMTGSIETLVNRAIDAVESDIDLDHPYTPELTEGSAVIAGQP